MLAFGGCRDEPRRPLTNQIQALLKLGLFIMKMYVVDAEIPNA